MMSPMNILHVEYLQACLTINYKNINKARNIKAITKIIAEYLPFQQRLSFIIKRKLHFFKHGSQRAFFLLKFPMERWCPKKGPYFHCLTYNHHQISVCHDNF